MRKKSKNVIIKTTVILAARKIMSRQKYFLQGDDVHQAMMLYALVKASQVLFKYNEANDVDPNELRYTYKHFIINPLQHVLFQHIMNELKKNENTFRTVDKKGMGCEKLFTVDINNTTIYSYTLNSCELNRVITFNCEHLHKLEEKRNKYRKYSRDMFWSDVSNIVNKITDNKKCSIDIGDGLTLEILNSWFKKKKIKSIFQNNTNIGLDMIARLIEKQDDVIGFAQYNDEHLKNLYSAHIDETLKITMNDIYDTFYIIRTNGLTTLNYAFTALHNVVVSKSAINIVENSVLDEDEIQACSNYIRHQFGKSYKNRCCQDPYKLVSIALRMIHMNRK